ncbi:hypothetical protein T439DRAFT_320555 [Meredithblackwellia eburnea MCA 4105]
MDAASSSTFNIQKPSKAPACDSCKASRVLCLGRESGNTGEGCPRCILKGIKCTTTPVVRRRPVKRSVGVVMQPTKPSLHDRVKGGLNSSTTPSPSKTTAAKEHLGIFSEIPLESVRRMFEDAADAPPANHPLVIATPVRDELERVNYRLEHLPTDLRILACLLLAIAATFTGDPYVFDATPVKLETATDLNSERLLTMEPSQAQVQEEDLRVFGFRRDRFCRLLKDQSMMMAKKESVMTIPSLVNAACCVLMQLLDTFVPGLKKPKARVWSHASLVHARCLVDEIEYNPGTVVRWSAFLMSEALSAVLHTTPIPFSRQDELDFCGECEPMPIRSLGEPLPERFKTGKVSVIGASIMPFSERATAVARHISDRIQSAAARRLPTNSMEFAIALQNLQEMGLMLDVITTHATLSLLALDYHAPFASRIAYTFTVAWASLHIPLYREIRRREEELQIDLAADPNVQKQQELHQVEALSRAVRQATLSAVIRASSALNNPPSLAFTTHLEMVKLHEWTQVLLSEGESAKEMGVDRTPALLNMVRALKRAGWSQVDVSPTIAAVELQLSLGKRMAPSLAPSPHQLMQPTIPPSDTFWDGYLSSDVSNATTPTSSTASDFMAGGSAPGSLPYQPSPLGFEGMTEPFMVAPTSSSSLFSQAPFAYLDPNYGVQPNVAQLPGVATTPLPVPPLDYQFNMQNWNPLNPVQK